MPEGEFGTKHVVSLWPITEDDFKQCQQNNWSPDPDLVHRIDQETQAELDQLMSEMSEKEDK